VNATKLFQTNFLSGLSDDDYLDNRFLPKKSLGQPFIKAAEEEGTAAYIEVVTDTYAAPPIAKKMHESLY
jgi:hypothetical protein